MYFAFKFIPAMHFELSLKIRKIHSLMTFQDFHEKSRKICDFSIFSKFSILLISINIGHKSITNTAFESVWFIFFEIEKIFNPASILYVSFYHWGRRFLDIFWKLWNFIIFKKYPKISFLNGRRKRRGLRQDWKFFQFQKIWTIRFQTPCLWCFYDQYLLR